MHRSSRHIRLKDTVQRMSTKKACQHQCIASSGHDTTYENTNITPCERYNSNYSGSPVNALISAPAEPEQANDHAPGTTHCAIQAMLGVNMRLAIRNCLSIFFLVECAIDDNGSYASKNDANQDGYKHETRLRGCERVRRPCEDVGESCEEQEQHCKGETCIKREKEHHWLRKIS